MFDPKMRRGEFGGTEVCNAMSVVRHWGDIINKVRLLGKTIIITRHDRPIAVMVPVERLNSMIEEMVLKAQVQAQHEAEAATATEQRRDELFVAVRRSLGLPDEKLEEPEPYRGLSPDGVYIPQDDDAGSTK